MTTEATLSPNDIYLTHPLIEIDGQRDDMVQALLTGMDLSENELGLSSLELRFFNSATLQDSGNDFAFEYPDNNQLSLGKAITLSAGDANDAQEMFRGKISGLEFIAEQDQQPELIVLAEDALQGARMQRRTKLHPSGTLSSIINAVTTDIGIQASITSLTEQVNAQLQYNETDLAFLRRLLRRYNGQMQMVGEQLQVSSRPDVSRTNVTLELGSQLLKVRVLADIAHQVSTVTFSGWDISSGREIEAASNAGAPLGPGQGRTGKELLEESFGERHEHLPHVNAQHQEEAQALVNACYADRARQFLCAEATAVGNPHIRVGSQVEFQGLGPRFENTFQVTNTHHLYNTHRGYITTFKAECAYLGE